MALLAVGMATSGCGDRHGGRGHVSQPVSTESRQGTPEASQKALGKGNVAVLSDVDARILAEAKARNMLRIWGCTERCALKVSIERKCRPDGNVRLVSVGFPAKRPRDWVRLVVTADGKVLDAEDWFRREADSLSREFESWRSSGK